MKGYVQLTLAQLKLFARNKSVIIWSTLFPLVLMVMIGLFMGGGTETEVDLAWVDEDESAYSEDIRASFEQSDVVQIDRWEDQNEAIAQLEDGQVSFVFIVPEDFGQAMEEQTDVPSFAVYYDEVNQSLAELGFALIEQEVDELNKALVDFEEIVSIDRVGLQSAELTFLDFLVPGILGLMILSSNLNGVTAQISSWREQGILRRLQSTGLRASTFIAAQITARFALNGAQALLILLVGVYLLGAQMNGSWILLLGYLFLGVLTFMAIGFIIASMARSPELASPIAGFITFPMFFLGGIFFPITNMPDFVQPISYFIPITHLVESMRQVMNLGATLPELWGPTLGLLIWFGASFAIAAVSFKWE